MSDINFMVEHTRIFGEYLWDIVAFVFLLAVVIFFFVRKRQMNKQEEELEDEISDHYAKTSGTGSF